MDAGRGKGSSCGNAHESMRAVIKLRNRVAARPPSAAPLK
jgi:hypothetical protein